MGASKVHKEANLNRFLLPAIGSILFSTFLSLISGHKYDLNIWLKTGELLASRSDIYAPQDHIGYPPLWAFWCLISYYIHQALGHVIWLFFIKLPLIMLIPLLGYELFKLTNSYEAYVITLCLSPIYLISSVWGQINIIISYLLVKFLNSFNRGKNLLSLFYLSTSLAVKPLHIIFIPYLLMLYRGWIRRILGLAILLTIPAISLIITIFFFNVNLVNFINTLYYQPMRLQLTGYGLMNLWSFIALHPYYEPNPIISQIWIPAILIVTYLVYNRRIEVIRSLCLILFTYIFIYPWVSEATMVDALTLLIPIALNYSSINTYILTFFFTSAISFNLMNGGLSLFDELLGMLSGLGLTGYLGSEFYDLYGRYIWTIRGIIGLICSIAAILVIINVFRLKSQVAYQ